MNLKNNVVDYFLFAQDCEINYVFIKRYFFIQSLAFGTNQ